MNERSSKFGLFLAELKRRHVWRAAIAYAAASFVLLQIGEIVLPAFSAPAWALRLLVVVTLLGFPVILVLAWIYEITPQGIRRTEDLDTGPQRRGRPGGLWPRLAFLGVTLVTVAGIGWWMMSSGVDWAGTGNEFKPTLGAVQPVSADPNAPIRSLAVLPLADFSEGGEQDYFSAGMHEAVIWQLSQLASVRVVSRTSVMQYAGTQRTAPQIARELGVQGIIEGSVLRSGDRVQITVQLIHGPSDTHLWSQRYERDLTDVIALQNEVAQAIAREIQAEITPAEETRFAALEEVDPDAHMAYMRGRWEASKGTAEGHEEAIEHFQEAVQLDSSYAPAYAGLAGSQFLLEVSGPDSTIDLESVVEAATKAMSLDAESPEAQAVISELNRYLVVQSESLSNQLMVVGVGLDSTTVPSADWVSSFTEFGSQLQKVELAREPTARGGMATERRVSAARLMAARGQYAEAEELLRQALERDPDLEAAWDELAYLRAVRGDFAGAVEVHRQRLAGASGPEELADLEELERAVAANGAEGYWSWRLRQLDQRQRRGDSYSQVDYAAALVALGSFDEALERIQMAVELRDRKLYTLAGDPIWDPVRGDPRFTSIVDRVRRVRPRAPINPDPN
jgi:TolB-like protein